MGSDEPRCIHLQSPEYLVERLDTIADLMGTDRTTLLVEAMREYIGGRADSDSFQQRVATALYQDERDFETATQLVGAEQAQHPSLLKADLGGEPFDLDAPHDTDVYGGDGAVKADDR